jgi:DNA-binding NtrC family response regulator
MMDQSIVALTVLIVDDDKYVRDILARWLTAAGYQTRQAEHARAALEAITNDEPAVAVCDVEMPGPDGVWLIGKVREQFPNVGLVLCTGVDVITTAVTMQDGVVAYVVKPFQRPQVLAAVASAAEWHVAEVARGGPRLQRGGLDTWLDAE